MQAETWYLPDDAVTAGLADEACPRRSGRARRAGRGRGEPDMARAWDLAAYGYTGPAAERPEGHRSPRTSPHAVGRRTRRSSPSGRAPAVEDATPVEPVAETTPVEPAPAEPSSRSEAAEPEPDEWAAAVAHLVQPKTDPWALLVARYTNSTSAASSATHAA
jgi:hypothetical protein